MARGMNTIVPAPMPLPRQWATAITAYYKLVGPEYDGDARGLQRWLNGVKFQSFGCDDPVRGQDFDPCTTDALLDAVVHGFGPEASFEPFLGVAGIECSTISTDAKVMQDWLSVHTAVSRSAWLAAEVERAAWTGGSNVSLSSEATNLNNSDQSLIGAVIAIENALSELLNGGVGMIHMPASLLTALAINGGLRFDAAGNPFTPSGHAIVADAGYLGVEPGTDEVADGETWIYGSGPVFAKLTDTIEWADREEERINFRRNQRVVQYQQYGLAIFDPCAVVAAVVNTSDDNIVGEGGGAGGDATAANQATANTRLQEIEDRIANIETSTADLVDALTADAATLSNVASQDTNINLLASAATRRGVIIHNDDTGVLYIKYGSTASTTSYTYKIPVDGTWEMPGPIYTGAIDGIWVTSGSGSARITELT